MKKILCVLCVVMILLGCNLVAFADPHAGPGTDNETTSTPILILSGDSSVSTCTDPKGDLGTETLTQEVTTDWPEVDED